MPLPTRLAAAAARRTTIDPPPWPATGERGGEVEDPTPVPIGGLASRVRPGIMVPNSLQRFGSLPEETA